MPDNILNWVDKVNSPELQAYLQQFGSETYLTAEEINSIRDAINALNNKPPTRTNGLISLGELIREGNNLKFPVEVAEWAYNNLVVKNTLEFTAVTPVATNGKYRTDLVAGDEFGNLLRVPGTEGDRVAILPNLPPNTVVIKQINVFGAQIDTSTPPVTGDPYIKKEFYSEIAFSLTGDIDAYQIGAQFGHYIFKQTGAMTSFSSLNLASTSLYLFVGKWLILENKQLTPILIKRNFGTGPQKLLVSYASDYLLQPGEKIVMTFTREFLSSGSFEFLTSNRAANITYVDLQSLATLNAAKAYVDARSTPQFTITGNMPLTNAHNGGILKIKATCTITVPSGLVSEFSCVVRTFAGATVTFVEGSGVSFDAQKGKVQDPFRMSTIFKDGSTSYILEGELRT